MFINQGLLFSLFFAIDDGDTALFPKRVIGEDYIEPLPKFRNKRISDLHRTFVPSDAMELEIHDEEPGNSSHNILSLESVKFEELLLFSIERIIWGIEDDSAPIKPYSSQSHAV